MEYSFDFNDHVILPAIALQPFKNVNHGNIMNGSHCSTSVHRSQLDSLKVWTIKINQTRKCSTKC